MSFFIRRVFQYFATVSVLAISANALAGTATSSLSVTSTVSNSCVISAGPLAFGAYDPIVANATTDRTGTATLTITCTNGAAANITIGQGSNANTGSTDAVPLRRMVFSGTNFLSYFLYQDAAHTTVWGNTAGTGTAYTGTGVQTASTTVYGVIPQAQDTVAGSFSDSAVVTITF
jgi:spore coat protein U-like protein